MLTYATLVLTSPRAPHGPCVAGLRGQVYVDPVLTYVLTHALAYLLNSFLLAWQVYVDPVLTYVLTHALAYLLNSFLLASQVYVDPVLAPDDHTYERAAIVEWLKNNDISPLTGGAMP